jgi:2-polyprenyl-6-methoxyphenol hydroxylase-like FAD-dependent oxidoreductase
MNQVDNHNTIEQIYPRHFDVLVLGGSVAGASAGLCLFNRGNVSVGLIDSGNHLEERAGESISPSVKTLLNFLGLWDQFVQTNSLEELGCEAAWGSSQLRSLDTSTALKNKRWHIDRNQFDVMLTDSFAARGGTLFRNTKVITCKNMLVKAGL